MLQRNVLTFYVLSNAVFAFEQFGLMTAKLK